MGKKRYMNQSDENGCGINESDKTKSSEIFNTFPCVYFWASPHPRCCSTVTLKLVANELWRTHTHTHKNLSHEKLHSYDDVETPLPLPLCFKDPHVRERGGWREKKKVRTIHQFHKESHYCFLQSRNHSKSKWCQGKIRTSHLQLHLMKDIRHVTPSDQSPFSSRKRSSQVKENIITKWEV